MYDEKSNVYRYNHIFNQVIWMNIKAYTYNLNLIIFEHVFATYFSITYGYAYMLFVFSFTSFCLFYQYSL